MQLCSFAGRKQAAVQLQQEAMQVEGYGEDPPGDAEEAVAEVPGCRVLKSSLQAAV